MGGEQATLMVTTEVPRDTSATINLRLSPLRKLAREMADNQMLDPAMAAAIARVPGVG
jgi:hypothetical protein